MRWQVMITGANQEMSELERSLCSTSLSFSKDDHGKYVLTSALFEGCGTADEVREVSKRVLDVLNGAARLALGASCNLSEAGVIEMRPDGKKAIHMHFSDTIHMRDSFTASTIDADGNVTEMPKPADQVPAWVDGALRDDAVGKVFRLFGQRHDWVGLYRIFEVIEADMGGFNKIVARGWSPKDQLKRFKHTANSPDAVGDEARHGKEPTQPPKSPMVLSEARALIETLIHHWLRGKGLNP